MTASKATDEDMPVIGGSPTFTPKNRDKPLPPIDKDGPVDLADTTSSATMFQSPMQWSTPKIDSSLHEKSLFDLFPDSRSMRYNDLSTARARDEWDLDDGLRQTRLDSFSDSPISYNSSSQLHSTRLSCSTLASSGTRTGSESSTATSPQAYGFAFGSPKRDQQERETERDRASQFVGNSAVGLGLTDDHQPKNAGPSGPFSHHRAPSWTMLNQFANGKLTFPAVTASIPEGSDNGHATRVPPLPPLGMSIPPRGASRSRTNSHSSGKLIRKESTLPRKQSSVDEVMLPRLSPARSFSSHSIASSTADSSFSRVSPRTSSLKKSKSRPILLQSKASEPNFMTLRPRLYSSAARAKSGSVSEVQTGFQGWGRSGKGSSSTVQDLDDYLAYTASGSGLSPMPSSPLTASVAPIEAREGVVVAQGRPLYEIEQNVTSSTTHLLLSGCQDAALPAFLNHILPLFGNSLLVLDLSHTGIMQLPDSLINCPNLEELNVSSNPLSRPMNFGSLSSLSSLRILLADSCQLSILPREIGDLQQLQTLSLQGNDLSHLPSWLHRLTQLERLYLEGNSFQGAWLRVCATFGEGEGESTNLSSVLIAASRPTFERGTASAPSRLTLGEPYSAPLSQESSYEDWEELTDETPATAPIGNGFIRSREEKPSSMRPLMRRMLSVGSETGRDEEGASEGILNRRRPSQGSDQSEKKWGTLMRKLGRKASNSQLSLSAVLSDSLQSSQSSSPALTRSNSRQASPELAKMKEPMTPVGWQDGSNEVTGLESLDRKMMTRSQDVEASQHRKIRALMQYLKDLEDLSALRLGPPGSLLPMETSMASQYSTPSKSVASTNQSGSETSRESVHSTSSSSSSIGAIDSSDKGPLQGGGKDDAQRRICILQEIVATEETYVRGLQELVDIYVVPSACSDVSSGLPTISAHERKHVFSNIEGIFHFHQAAFLPALRVVTDCIVQANAEDVKKQREDVESYNAMSARLTEQVAGVFSRHAAYFRMYSAYVNNVDAAQKRVSQWRLPKTSEIQALAPDGSPFPPLNPKERKRIRTFLQRARSDPRHVQLSLETYLHLPVQRIPRYRLLFEDLVRSCPAHRLQDSSAITRALDSICSVATLMNESKRQSENDRKLLEWQARIRGHFASPLLQPHRRLLRDGDLILKRVVMRTTAFHMAKSQWLEEECRQCIESDGAVTDTDLGIVQVDCLDQQSMNKKVKVLLCNDITVIVVQDSQQQGPSSQVDLIAVLRIQCPIQIIGQTTLRVVDPKHILYFSASSPAQAQDWKAAMSSVHQEPRSLKSVS